MLAAFADLIRNLRSNFLQTALSILGIIIGVAALVAMLSLINGIEDFVGGKMVERPSLRNVNVRANTTDEVDGVSVPRDTIAELTPYLIAELMDSLPHPAKSELSYYNSTIGKTADSISMGLNYYVFSYPVINIWPDSIIVHGRDFTAEEGQDGSHVAIVNTNVARRLVGEDGLLMNALDQPIFVFGDSLTVVGIVDAKKSNSNEESDLTMVLPMSTFIELPDIPTPYPRLQINVENFENVVETENYVKGFLGRRFGQIRDPFQTFSRRNSLQEMQQGMLLFRMVMGFIIGIAVVVGGIGVMNVLLMSISERTPEIGIRKAVGASRKTIVRQFLAESVAISVVGCAIGTVFGMGFAMLAAWIISTYEDNLDFTASFSLGTLLTVSVIAVVIGIVFGTYPARKAAGLEAVEAIQR